MAFNQGFNNGNSGKKTGSSGGGGGGGSADLVGLTDTTITGTPANNEVLKYDTSTGKWINGVGQGATGADGKTILSGTVPPSSALGVVGDFYIDTVTQKIYGDKTSSGWGTGVDLNGPDGSDGKTILSGNGTPASTLGVDGDFYIDTQAWEIYGAKAGGAWGSATSILYTHPSGDGNLHVPPTSTTNSGNVLTAGATAGSLSWAAPASGGGGGGGSFTGTVNGSLAAGDLVVANDSGTLEKAGLITAPVEWSNTASLGTPMQESVYYHPQDPSILITVSAAPVGSLSAGLFITTRQVTPTGEVLRESTLVVHNTTELYSGVPNKPFVLDFHPTESENKFAIAYTAWNAANNAAECHVSVFQFDTWETDPTHMVAMTPSVGYTIGGMWFVVGLKYDPQNPMNLIVATSVASSTVGIRLTGLMAYPNGNLSFNSEVHAATLGFVNYADLTAVVDAVTGDTVFALFLRPNQQPQVYMEGWYLTQTATTHTQGTSATLVSFTAVWADPHGQTATYPIRIVADPFHPNRFVQQNFGGANQVKYTRAWEVHNGAFWGGQNANVIPTGHHVSVPGASGLVACPHREGQFVVYGRKDNTPAGMAVYSFHINFQRTNTPAGNGGTLVPELIIGAATYFFTSVAVNTQGAMTFLRYSGGSPIYSFGLMDGSKVIGYGNAGGQWWATDTPSNVLGNRLVGISDGAYATGSTATIKTTGSIDTNQSNLETGVTYYTHPDGVLSSRKVKEGAVVGVALSSTDILIK